METFCLQRRASSGRPLVLQAPFLPMLSPCISASADARKLPGELWPLKKQTGSPGRRLGKLPGAELGSQPRRTPRPGKSNPNVPFPFSMVCWRVRNSSCFLYCSVAFHPCPIKCVISLQMSPAIWHSLNHVCAPPPPSTFCGWAVHLKLVIGYCRRC